MFHSSGDLLADRRYDYARAAAAEGDHAAAQDLLLQTLELAPGWPPAWFALGEARLALNDSEGARAAYLRCRALDPADDHGASVALAALDAGGGGGAEMDAGSAVAMSAGYVRHLFDQYAERFDDHLTRHLGYRGPELLCDAIARACAIEGVRPPFQRALDLGCGTGLFGEQLGGMAKAIDGVDLSPRMLRMAKKRGCYDQLSDADLLVFLKRAQAARYDLIAASDVLINNHSPRVFDNLGITFERLAQVKQIAQVRYAQNAAAFIDFVNAQVAESSARNDLLAFQQQALVALAQINTLAGRPLVLARARQMGTEYRRLGARVAHIGPARLDLWTACRGRSNGGDVSHTPHRVYSTVPPGCEVSQ